MWMPESGSLQLQPGLRRIASHRATCLHSPPGMLFQRHHTRLSLSLSLCVFSRFVFPSTITRIRFERVPDVEERAAGILPTRATSRSRSSSFIPRHNPSDPRQPSRETLLKEGGTDEGRRSKRWMFPLVEHSRSIESPERRGKDLLTSRLLPELLGWQISDS